MVRLKFHANSMNGLCAKRERLEEKQKKMLIKVSCFLFIISTGIMKFKRQLNLHAEENRNVNFQFESGGSRELPDKLMKFNKPIKRDEFSALQGTSALCSRVFLL